MSEFVARAPAAWIVDHVPAANTAAVATKAAAANTRHFITGISFSYAGGLAAIVSVQIKSATTVIATFKVDADGAYDFDFARPIRANAANELVSVTVPAGGAAVEGTATIRGFSKKE